MLSYKMIAVVPISLMSPFELKGDDWSDMESGVGLDHDCAHGGDLLQKKILGLLSVQTLV